MALLAELLAEAAAAAGGAGGEEAGAAFASINGPITAASLPAPSATSSTAAPSHSPTAVEDGRDELGAEFGFSISGNEAAAPACRKGATKQRVRDRRHTRGNSSYGTLWDALDATTGVERQRREARLEALCTEHNNLKAAAR